MQKYRLSENGHFLIEDFQNLRPFSSFLPGIAGTMGMPLWVFYVNRGQAIASFGVENKDKPIMEFQPANRAYQLTSILGFRTFMRIKRGTKLVLREPFSRGTASQKMSIGDNELVLEEIDQVSGLTMQVVYFLLPGEAISGLVRRVEIINQSHKALSLEVLDGLPVVIPFGVNDRILKDIGRTAEAWMEVNNLEKNIPFFRLKASIPDTSEVSPFEAGHYMLAFQEDSEGSKILPAIVDPIIVFGQNTSYSTPDPFYQKGLDSLLSMKQIAFGRTPCGFTGTQAELGPGESLKINSIFGHAGSLEVIESRVSALVKEAYLNRKRSEAKYLVRNLTDAMCCRTGTPTFDAYCRQTFLDNTLRGGWPVTFGRGNSKKVFHIYSRKHGDLERDYNNFSLPPEFFSQGNGSYRDINQNRRDDVWFNPAVGDFNIRAFMSLIQLDGYNPLIILGSHFTVPSKKLDELLQLVEEPAKLLSLLSGSFTLGGLFKELVCDSVGLRMDTQAFIEKVLDSSVQTTDATFGEGYWVDHWTYNLDLIESYLAVYPDCRHELFFAGEGLPYFDSPMIVPPRSRKYVLLDGKPHQLGSPIEDRNKAVLLSSRDGDNCWARVGHGTGEIYRSNLFVKLFNLAVIKIASLDPCGMGIEMEAGRPGWYDALNGLPGLFGSSMSETYALKRLIKFLRDILKDEKSGKLLFPLEMTRLIRRVVKEIKHYSVGVSDEYDYQHWDNVTSARENYRTSVRQGLDGKMENIGLVELEEILGIFEAKVDAGIKRALAINNDVPPTYFSYQVDEFVLLKDNKGIQITDGHGHPCIRPTRFKLQVLPLFLEGIMKSMSVSDKSGAQRLYNQVRESTLYDRKLKMYKVCAPLEALSIDVGRARAFTPGWLENESIWLHMEYKYLLEVLRAGLYKEFFEDFKTALIPFLDPKVYGRSILENSSFLVSSAHPDELLHGAGFVARLSGATAEFISIWRRLMAGERPFFVQEDQLCLALRPILPGWLFNADNSITFKFLGNIIVTYHNPSRRDTFDPGSSIQSIVLHPLESDPVELKRNTIYAPYARKVRSGQIHQIDVYFV